MGNRWKAAGWAAGLLMCLTASEAFAGIDVIDVEDSNSWISNTRIIFPVETGGALFDRIVLTSFSLGTIVTTTTNGGSTGAIDCLFEAPTVMTNFTKGIPGAPAIVGTWTQNAGATTLTVTSSDLGFLRDTLGFKLHFSNPSNPGATTGFAGFNIDLYNGALRTAFGSLALQKFGSGNSFRASEGRLTSTVPVPAAVWSGLPVLGGMMLLLRRRKRRMLA